MLRLSAVLAVLLLSVPDPAAAQDRPLVDAKELRKYLNQVVSVEGKVVATASSRNEPEQVPLYPSGGFNEVVYLYFDRRAPFEAFIGVITGNASRQNHRYWRNKQLRITGRAEEVDARRFRVVVGHPDDIEILEKP